MIEQFLQKKIADLLIEFVEFEKNKLFSMQGLKLTNSKIKSKLVDIMSQVLGMPLQLNQGIVDQIKLNMPWQKLFLVTNSSIKLQIAGFKLKTKLKNKFNENYTFQARQSLIKHLTSKLISSQQSTSPLIKKLKQYFMDTLELGIKDIHLEIEVDLEQKIDLIIKFQSITGRQQHKTNTLKVNVQNFSVSYRVKNSQPQPLLFPTNMTLTRQKRHLKTEIISEKTANIQKIHLNINNHNFNDIRRLLCLISWHNSFMHLPLHLWKEKPLPLIKTKPKKKFQYYVTLMDQKFKVQKNYRKILQERKIYNSIYTEILKGSKDINKKKILEEMENKMYVWRIIAYRNFCIERLKEQSKKKNQQKSKIQEKSEEEIFASEKSQIIKAENKLNGYSWLKPWFRTESNEKQLIDQLQEKLNKIETIPTFSILNVTVRQIFVNIEIITYSARQRFLLAKALDITYKYEKDEKIESEKHEAIFGKFRIEYDEYLGHDKKYFCLLETIRQGQIRMNLQVEQSEEQFEEIQNFIQFRSYPDFHVKIQPIKICINREIIQRLSVFDFQSIQSLSEASEMNIVNHMDPYNILKEMNKSFSPRIHPRQVVHKLKQISKGQDSIIGHQHVKVIETGLEILIPQQMAKELYPCNQIVCQIQSIQCKLFGSTKKQIKLQDIGIKCRFPDEGNHNYEAMLLGQKNVQNFRLLGPFSMEIQQSVGQNQHTKFYDISIKKNLVFDFQSDQKISKLIKMLIALKPSSKETRNLYRMKMRRKQSIGEQFIDACENLNQHIFKSSISTDVKPKKYSPLIQKTRNICLKTQDIKFQLKQALLALKQIQIQVTDQSLEGLYISSQQKKTINFDIYDVKEFKKYLENFSKKLKIILPQTEKLIPKVPNQDDSSQSDKKTEVKVQKIDFEMNVYYEKVSFLKISLSDIQFASEENRNYIDLYFLTEFRNGSLKESSPFLPLIQKTKVFYLQKKSYNCFLREFTISSLSVDFTPQIFKFLTKIYRIYLQSLQSSVKIQNQTLNSIKLNSMISRYVDVKPFQTQCLQAEKDCNMILFGNKIELDLKNQFQKHQLTQNCYLLKVEKKLRVHTLESNIKIVNLQDRTIWVSIKEQRQEDQLFPPKPNQVIDIKYLSAAKSFDFNQGELSSRPRRVSIHKKFEKEENNENINMPLKPKQDYSILVKSEDQYLEIIDQGTVFRQVKISEILSKRQIIIGDQDDEYLVLRSTQKKQDKITFFKIEVLSPIYIVNKLPWKISYRMGKQALDVESIVNTKGKIIKKRSFQAIPMQKILPLQHNKIRSLLYQEIIDIQIVMNEFTGFFKVETIIEDMKKMRGKAQKWPQSTLVCLSNGKKNLQIILKLQISDHTLKIKVYPEYVFVNLCEMDFFFKIMQSEYTYPQIKLKTIKDSRKGHNLTDQQMEIQSFVKTYISLTDESYNKKEILQQLFMDFEDRIEIFAGSINKNLKRFIVYESGTRLSSSSSNGYNSTGGYTSGYGSGSDSKEYMPHYCSEELSSESTLQYGASKSQVHYRNIGIEEYFNLVIFVPTIKIINKSNSTFMVKSRANKRLLKIQGQEMNFLSINSQGFSVQALDQNEEVNLNEWFNINVYVLGTVYYAKQLSSSGYESKEYTLRKKRLKKRPKLFYRIVLSQHQRGIQVLIQQSQYPPLSFINKTSLKLKVQEETQGFEEQLGPNQMAEFASTKNPYSQPIFKLFYAEHYEYLFVQNFQVDEFKTIPCSKSSKFVISVEEFKEKKIVVFGDEKLLQMSDIKNEFQIQKVQKLNITINSIVVSFMTEFYKEFSALKISGIEFQKQDKNQKQQFKFKISDIEGYDYSGIHPKIGFQKLQEQKNDIFSTLTKPISNNINKSIFSSKIVISYHKNAVIVQKCHLRLASLKVIFNSYLILENIKVYQSEVWSFFKLLKTYSGNNLQKRASNQGLIKKEFIFQSFIWQSTSITFQCLNLNIFCAFLDKNYYKWIIKFLEWVGDLKPIKFSKHTIQYENYTIEKLIKRIDIKKKMGQFANILFEYPIRELIHMTNVFLGENQLSYKLKAKMLLKIAKGFGKILYNSGLIPGVSKSQSINQSQQGHISYRQQFEQTHSIKTTETVLDKIKIFQFAQWRYEQKFLPNKLTLTPINRLERYNLKNKILQYDMNFARVKVALDSFYRNKIHRKIQFVEPINPKTVLGLTEEALILYFQDKDEWVVKKHQEIVDLYFVVPKLPKNSLEARKILKIVTSLSPSQISDEKKLNSNKEQQMINFNKSKLKTFDIQDPWLSSDKLLAFKKFIESNKLIQQF